MGLASESSRVRRMEGSTVLEGRGVRRFPPASPGRTFTAPDTSAWQRGKANRSVQMLRFCRRSRCLTARTETGQRGVCPARPREVGSAHTLPVEPFGWMRSFAPGARKKSRKVVLARHEVSFLICCVRRTSSIRGFKDMQ